MPLEDAMERINDSIVNPLVSSEMLDGGYLIRLSGTADKLRQTWAALKWNLLLALAITYLLMAALFESWLYPFVIIFSVPLGAVGGILGLTVLNLFVFQSLDVLTMLGFVILIGTVVNNAILIVHQSLNYIREQDMDPRDAIPLSIRMRVRPIFHHHPDHGSGTAAADSVSWSGQRTLSRAGQRCAGWSADVNVVHVVPCTDRICTCPGYKKPFVRHAYI